MPKLIVFNSVSLDGYFSGENGDLSWAHTSECQDPEWRAFVEGNAQGGGRLVFGRITYEMMAGWWPTPEAAKSMPVVAERMNAMPKIVFSRTLKKATWANTTLIKDNPAGAMRRLKRDAGPDMAIMGSGSIVSQLTQEGLIDDFQLVVIPVVLGRGRTMFEGVRKMPRWTHTATRTFGNGYVLLGYEPPAQLPRGERSLSSPEHRVTAADVHPG